MSGKNGENFSFLDQGKESIQDRLKSLMKGRSLRKVSQDWGYPYSTLNNYFTKGTMPAVDVLVSVAQKEQVPLNWLILGLDEEGQSLSIPHKEQPQQPQQPQQDTSCTGGGAQTLIAIWESLEPEEKLHVSKQLGRKGAEVLTQLLDDDNLCLMKLTGEKREAALLLVEMEPERAREILSKMREHGGLENPENHQVNPKRAGAA
ncbi:XRE family transcriptional regulator [Salmonella enterica]|nr:XRE family transcriptional regulator [Salmonella enterica]